MKQRYYSYAGLRVRSDLPIPEWTVFEEKHPFAVPEVIISLAPAADAVPDLPVVSPDEYNFCVPEIGAYRVRGGREILVTPAPKAGQRELRLFLLGSAWGALCYQRGFLSLHSSAIQVGDGAVAFCGSSGSGKSTAAAWLLNRGFLFAGDDLSRFDAPAGGKPIIYPSATHLKLWHEAFGPLGRDHKGLERDHFRQEKYHVPLPGAKKRLPLPIRAIYLLEWGELGLTRLTGRAALSRLISVATYRGDLLEPMGRLAAQWEMCAALIRQTPVWEFRRPKDWGAMEEAMKVLLEHFKMLHFKIDGNNLL